MKWHFADVLETVAALVPDQPALVSDHRVRSWRAYEDRASRLAKALVSSGLEPGAKVAIYARNSSEFLEAQFAVFKARAVPVNVNYRYVEDELRYLFCNADVEAVFFDAGFAARLAAIQDDIPPLKLKVVIGDAPGLDLPDAEPYEQLVSRHERLDRLRYDETDRYMLYTGGTTGMLKGVVYEHKGLIKGLLGTLLGPDTPVTPEVLIERVRQLAASGEGPVSMPVCPLMHATGMWIGAFRAHFLGGAVATLDSEVFDPHAVWSFIERHRVSAIAIVGDAFARPLLAALQEADEQGRPYDVSALTSIGSSGVMFSSEVKVGLLAYADVQIRDAIGSTEGSMGASIVSRQSPPGQTAQFAFNRTTRVFNERDLDVTPGSDEIGMIANGGFVPVEYYKDPEKSARTFREVGGQRYAFSGDFAMVAADGTLILLGRGSNCINTGGEKVFPEEVEEALKGHDSIWDALVVGVPDKRFGEKVVAVVSPAPGMCVDTDAVDAFVRQRIAGYKTPRKVIEVADIRRADNGKGDYGWAKAIALEVLEN
jgi:fatty-acyl-CoA synthase